MIPAASEPEISFDKLLKDLNSRTERRRKTAFETACRLSPDELLELVELEAEKYAGKLRNRQVRIRSKSFLGLIVCVAIYYFTHDIFQFGLLGFYTVIENVVSIYPQYSSKNMVKLITQSDDIRLTGHVVIVFVKNENRRIQKKCAAFLITHLPQITEEHDSVFTFDQKQALVKLLREPWPDPDLIVPVLQAIEKVGDSSAIPTVKSLIKYRNDMIRRSKKVYQVQNAAKDCLLNLELKAERQRISSTLLRASSTAVTPDVLLHPIYTSVTAHTDQEQLVRAENPE